MADIRRQWFRGPIGYRDAQLESSDLTAAMTLFVGGIPALIVGADLVGQGIGIGQLILAVPLGSLLGALLVGMIGRQAAASGVPSAYLGRAAFGSLGGVLFNVVRLALTLAWAALVMRVGAGWMQVGFAHFGLSVPAWAVVTIIGALGAAMFFPGPAWAVARLLRRRLFWLAVLILLVGAWRILSVPGPVSTEVARGGFLEIFDAVVGLALLWSVVGGDIGGYGHREGDTASGLGYGFAVASLLFVMAGAILANRLEGFPNDVVIFGTGAMGAFLVLLWVPLMEVDGAGGLSASTAWSLETIVPWIAPQVLMVVGTGAAIVAASVLPLDTLRAVADLALTLLAPAVGVMLIDAYVVRGGAYSADELFRWRGDYGLVNLVGLGCWVAAAAVALWLRPKSETIRQWLPDWPGQGPAGWPGLLVGMAVAAILYFAIGQLILGRAGRTYHMRGV
jgi:purine-cytosine permease-like protein